METHFFFEYSKRQNMNYLTNEESDLQIYKQIDVNS